MNTQHSFETFAVIWLSFAVSKMGEHLRQVSISDGVGIIGIVYGVLKVAHLVYHWKDKPQKDE